MRGCWRYKRYIFICFLIVILTDCTNVSMAPTPVRDVLFPKERPPVGYGAYGYLIFTRRASGSDQDRYLAVCQAFMRNLEPISSYASSVSRSLMPTYWLATNELNKTSRDCKVLVEKYDYSRGKITASAISKLSSNGPLLVAWGQPYEAVPLGQKALVLDLSDFSDEDLDRAFGIWRDRITRDPKVWHSGFDIILAKEAFRNFLEKYGERIISAVVKTKEILS